MWKSCMRIAEQFVRVQKKIRYTFLANALMQYHSLKTANTAAYEINKTHFYKKSKILIKKQEIKFSLFY